MRRAAKILLCLAAGAPAGAAAQSLAEQLGGCGAAPPVATLAADPSSYLSLLPGLQPGERLLLAPGIYPGGLPIDGLAGAPSACIVIEGPESGPRAIFTGRDCCNTVSIRDASYLVIRNLELDGQARQGDGVKAEADSTSSHHVTLENLHIHGHGAGQQIVGINTKSPAWNWVIRRNVIEGAGTGIYLGDSNGEEEFVNGLIEHNLVRDSLGYNLQVKHQNGRSTALGMPASGTTIIRHNVFSKAQNAASGSDARPNLLVGHWPLSGAGSGDVYQIYGNLFYRNPVEALLQGEGNVALHDNLFVNDLGSLSPAVTFQPHEDLPRSIEIFHNTVLAAGAGISVTGGHPSFEQRVRGNAVFASPAIQGGDASDNLVDALAGAGAYLVEPAAPLGAGLDLFPLPGQLGGPVDLTGVSGWLDWDRDFNGSPRIASFRGAYSGEGTNPGWMLALSRKPEPPPETVAISIGDASRTEGGAGSAAALFEVSLSAPSTVTIRADYATSDGTATAGSDYAPASGSVSFAPGDTSRTIHVGILGDWVYEFDESFFVDLSGPAGGTLQDDRGEGLIINDDAQGLSLDDVAIAEPEVGSANAAFPVTLAPGSGSTVTVDFTTMADSATSPGDFLAISGTLTFQPGTTGQSILVPVNADASSEGVERFFVDLTASSGAPIARSRATGTIYDPGAFFTVAPCRLVDTRNANGPAGGPALAGGASRSFAAAGVCGVASSAKAVSLNVAVTGATSAGHLRLHAAGTPLPLVSAINYASGQTRSNNAVVPLGAAGELAVYSSQASGTVHVILDVNGYFE